MYDDILNKAKDFYEGQIDFHGQQLADLLITRLIILSSALAFLVGIVMQDMFLTTCIGLGGVALTVVVVLPPWPFFNKNPVNWLPSPRDTAGIRIVVLDGKKVD